MSNYQTLNEAYRWLHSTDFKTRMKYFHTTNLMLIIDTIGLEGVEKTYKQVMQEKASEKNNKRKEALANVLQNSWTYAVSFAHVIPDPFHPGHPFSKKTFFIPLQVTADASIGDKAVRDAATQALLDFLEEHKDIHTGMIRDIRIEMTNCSEIIP